MFLQFVRIGGIWGYGGIGRRRTFIALVEWKALMVGRFERKPTRKMNKSYRIPRGYNSSNLLFY
jgi:hypothetical protein